ncbi:hypothetical protein GGS21DRAFT_492203 [Xylaria nigripes]|nr:hypothetical protein GGS21DRAFT_492203 [Xylaria nigripes]
MAGIPGFVGFAVDDEISSSLIKRQKGCLLCPDQAPDCPTCADDESCISLFQTCDQCQRNVCMKDPNKIAAHNSPGPNVGAIAGGVIGGLVLVAALTYLVWRYCIKNKRASYADQWQGEGERTKEHIGNDFASRHSQRESTHTVHSIASTVLTRASNIIQIAYIPGVTNRAAPSSPTLLVPPVPPIPVPHAGSANSSPYQDQHFFVPGDLRDSTYSGFSSFTDRMSFARTSFAPRSSVASTIYGKNAIVSPVPAQRGNVVKPSIVSVRSRAPSTTSDNSAPPIPSLNYEKYDRSVASSSTGSAASRNASASTATSLKSQVVRLGGGLKTVEIKPSKLSSTMTMSELESPSLPVELPAESVVSGKEPESVAVKAGGENKPTSDQGPFADPPSTNDSTERTSPLSTVVEDSTGRGSPTNSSRNFSSAVRNNSPFGDENAMRE